MVELDGRDPDAIAYDRPPDAFRHCRLVDHPRTDWAFTIARRYLYDTADAVRLEALADSTFVPLAELVAKIRREETYHLVHAEGWLRRLAEARPEGRSPPPRRADGPGSGRGDRLHAARRRG